MEVLIIRQSTQAADCSVTARSKSLNAVPLRLRFWCGFGEKSSCLSAIPH
jgi:hypothetical protein